MTNDQLTNDKIRNFLHNVLQETVTQNLFGNGYSGII